MQIIEIYKSLQGESSYAGFPARLCGWRDQSALHLVRQRIHLQRRPTHDLEDIEREVHRLSPDGGLVEITGGEPLLQEREAILLMDRLLGRGYNVLLETSGERPLDNVPPAVVKIVDVKCPDSGEGDTFRIDNLPWLTPHDEVKFVVASGGITSSHARSLANTGSARE